MSESGILYLDRSEMLHVIDPDCLQHYDQISPLMKIVIAVINAGYNGICIDEKRLANGRYFQAINTNSRTPEGRIINDLGPVSDKDLPTPRVVLEQIREEYRRSGGHS